MIVPRVVRLVSLRGAATAAALAAIAVVVAASAPSSPAVSAADAAAGPLHVAVFGDSNLENQGVPRASKHWAQYADYLERRTGRTVDVDNYSHSGSPLTYRHDGTGDEVISGGSCDKGFAAPQEVPAITPAILDCQIPAAAAAGTDYDLVLLDGCIVDVGAVPTETGYRATSNVITGTDPVVEAVSRYCKAGLKASITAAHELPGHPKVAVLGQFKALSNQTVPNRGKLRRFATLLGLNSADEPLLAAARNAAQRFEAFVDAYETTIRQVIRELDAGDWATFVPTGLGDDDALFASHDKMWHGFDDPLYLERSKQCLPYLQLTPICPFASVGHPDQDGTDVIAGNFRASAKLNTWFPRGDGRPATTTTGRYAALGSSFAAGPGLPATYDLGCLRSTDNYAHRVARQLNLDLTDVTCFGATSEQVASAKQLTLTGQRPPQVSAIPADTKLVTVTAGGNDVGYVGSLFAYGCADASANPAAGFWTPFVCTATSVDQATIDQKLTALPGQLRTMLAAIRDRAPKAKILLVTYPRIVPADGSTCPALALSGEHAAYERTVGDRLQNAFVQVAGASGSKLVDVYPDAGHDACSSDPWVSGWQWGSFPFGTVAFHPTPAGMQAAADRIAAAAG